MGKRKQPPPQRRRPLVLRVGMRILQQLAGRGALVITLAVLLAAIGGGTWFGWKHAAPQIRDRAEYQLRAESIEITSPPAWIRTDVKFEVLRDGALASGLSILDPNLPQRLRDSFEMHPWIERVHQIRKIHPARVEIDLTYRRPVAVVVSGERDLAASLPVDAMAYRLPATDLPAGMRTMLPRIRGNFGETLVGQPYRDPRVVGGAGLAALLAKDWQRLNLVDIVPSSRAERRGDERHFTYELVAVGGTRIRWGAAPGWGPADEPPASAKRERLEAWIADHGPLTQKDGPALIDVRYELSVLRRTAEKPYRDNELKRLSGETPRGR